ncbi:hypothetical protein GALMADRAFT_143327 [Galerina marginata CBS 339.88]|uniref:Uncharacterized protein n=1 Tax=Galerina marginata (strain CBS 339.88) TaxID=685588 RepID=A0A067SPP2_GALM3|nr:hypothetical protein GALMADRAFT_143327 [Galerina marginata CBS 339.88]
MQTPAVLYVDDRDPLVHYAPNVSWAFGGNVSDYAGTSTYTGTLGATASLTFSGKLQFKLYVLIFSYYLSAQRHGLDNGPAVLYNATEQPQFQFQKNLFQSGPLTPASHTLVVTHLANNANFFVDYFLVTPPDSSITLAPTGGIDKSHSGGVPIAAIVGGSLGGFALIVVAVFVLWHRQKRAKHRTNTHQTSYQPYPDLLDNPIQLIEQYQPSRTPNISTYPAIVSPLPYPTPSAPSQGMIPPSKAIQGAQPSATRPVPTVPFGNTSNLDNPTNSGPTNPPRYE